MHFDRCLINEEGAAEEQDEIPPGDGELVDMEDRLDQLGHPGETEQQDEAADEGKCQTDEAGSWLLVLGQQCPGRCTRAGASPSLLPANMGGADWHVWCLNCSKRPANGDY